MRENKGDKKTGILGLFFRFSVGSWFSAALAFFTTPVVTALIVPEEFGRASMFTLAYSVSLQIVLLGTDQSFVRRFYDSRYEKARSSLLQNCVLPSLTLGLVLSAVCLLFWKQISILLIEKQEFEICVLLAATVMIGILERYAVLVIRMFKKGLLFSVLRIVSSIVTYLIIVLYCSLVGKTMYAILYSIFIPLMISAAIAMYVERNMWFGKFTVHKEVITSLLRYGIPFVPTFIAYWIFEGVDKMALRNFSSFTEIGLFTAALKIVALLTILQISFSTFWAPVAFEAYEKRTDESKIVFKKIFGFLSLAMFTGGLAIMTGRDIIMLFFDESYKQAGFIMPFLLLIPMMYTMSEVTVGGINFKNKTYLHFIITTVVALVNVAGNYLLVPVIGAKGAAISTGISYVVFFYFRTWFSVRLFPIDFGLKRVTASILIIIIDAFVYSFYPVELWTLLLSLAFFVMLLLLYRDTLRSLFSLTLMKLKLT